MSNETQPTGATPRRALITGGTNGIGLGIAHALTENGGRVALMGRDRERAAAALESWAPADRERVLVVAGDVADEAARVEAVEATTAAFGGLDVLVNNAGTTVRGRPEDCAIEDYEAVLDVNLTAAFRMSQLAHPALRASGQGRVINIASLTSFFGSGFSLPYAVSKGGIVQLTKSLALAWAQDGILVNAIAPGWIDTDLTAATRQHVPTLDRNVVDRTPLHRWGTPAEIGSVAAFLAGPGASFINGTVITVDGGYSASI